MKMFRFRRGLRASLITGAALGALAVAGVDHAQAYAFAEYGPIAFGSSPVALAAGPGGAMWFTESGNASFGGPAGIGRVGRDGRVTEFRDGLPEHAVLRGLVRGPDRTMWFADRATAAIGRVTAAGEIREYPAGVHAVDGLARGADGHVWFVADAGQVVGWIGSEGIVHRFRGLVRSAAAQVTGVAAGPGRRLWFTAGARVVSVTISGHVTWRRFAGTQAYTAIARGPDDRLWLAPTRGRLIRVGARGRRAPSISGRRFTRIAAMAPGPGDRMWLALPGDDEVAELSRRGTLSWRGPGLEKFDALRPTALARDDRGRMWAAGQDRVVRYVPTPGCAVPDVMTLPLSEARPLLREGGCGVRVRTDGAPGAGPLRVIGQSARSGRVLARGSTVTVTVGHLACRYPTGWSVKQESGLATVATHLRRHGGYVSQTWSGCAKAEGLPRELASADNVFDDELSGFMSVGVQLAGSYALLSETNGDRYGTYYTLRLVDLARPDPAVTIVTLDNHLGIDGELLANALNPAGVVAWVQWITTDAESGVGTQAVLVKVPGTPARIVRHEASGVADLHVGDDTVSWTESGAPKSAPIAP